MKKITALTLTALLSVPVAQVFTSCSSEDLDEEVMNVPEEQSEHVFQVGFDEKESRCLNLLIPKDLMNKVNAIFSAATTGPQTVTSVHQLATLTSICATPKGDGPISVTSASLNGEDITLVTLGGTEMVEGQATGTKESGLASKGKSNDYLVAVTKLFDENVIPKGKPVVVTGISLGGMIAQQVLGQQSIMDNYSIRAVITFGSPLTMPIDRKGVQVVRFADVHDRVPAMGEGYLRSGLLTVGKMSLRELRRTLKTLDATERIARSGIYTGMIETHMLSYLDDPCWDNVDFLGDPSKKNVLVLKENMKFYPAPRLK